VSVSWYVPRRTPRRRPLVTAGDWLLGVTVLAAGVVAIAFYPTVPATVRESWSQHHGHGAARAVPAVAAATTDGSSPRPDGRHPDYLRIGEVLIGFTALCWLTVTGQLAIPEAGDVSEAAQTTKEMERSAC
jgi:hypothetical protein